LEVNLKTALTTTLLPSIQTFAPSTGAGSLEASRGTDHLTMDGVALTGEQDIFGKPFVSSAMASLEALGSSWSGGDWNGSSWSGSSWSGSSWSGRCWSGGGWAGGFWCGGAWWGRLWVGRSRGGGGACGLGGGHALW